MIITVRMGSDLFENFFGLWRKGLGLWRYEYRWREVERVGGGSICFKCCVVALGEV